ncbi:hypothetical protein ABB27_09130 [Stenotrophomonas terrae]|uniref:Transmembrane protein n=1 Tax=Stenotrophomonas terrae TaxID=405446 RepID=A0A0R0CP94_9GAMM|nr:hypothetical protein [Stenotrophomonas terrae]KRG67719.1 hypothetical protein ABB27_09130 [Stenotrophomonas terrae]
MTSDDLSLMRGGLVYRAMHWLGLLRSRLALPPLIAGVLVTLACLPLLLACAWEGSLLPGRVTMPLLADTSFYARFALALPLLVLAAAPADCLLRSAVRQLNRAGLVPANQHAAFDTLVARARALRDSHIPEWLCLLVALAPALLSPPVVTELTHISGWHAHADGSASAAAWWAWWVSLPLFRLVGLMWIWRFLIWTVLLWRLTRLDLDLRPPHPDGAGGIGFLGFAQQRFSALSLAGGIVLSGSCINHFVYAGQTLGNVHYLLAAYIVGSAILLLAPLALLSPALIRAKRHALLKYSALGHRAIRSFDLYWKRGQPDEDAPSLLDSPQPSALADFASVYASLARMSLVPICRGNVLWMLFSAAVPLLPLVFFAMSVDSLVSKLASILF